MWDVDSACRYDAKERGMQAFKNSCLRRLLRILYIRPMNFAKNHYHTHRIPETSPCNSEAVLVWCDHVIQHNVLSKTVLLETLSIWHCSGQRKTGLRTWRSRLVLCRTHSITIAKNRFNWWGLSAATSIHVISPMTSTSQRTNDWFKWVATIKICSPCNVKWQRSELSLLCF